MDNLVIFKPVIDKEIINLFQLISNVKFNQYTAFFELKKILKNSLLDKINDLSNSNQINEYYRRLNDFNALDESNYVSFNKEAAMRYNWFLKELKEFIKINFINEDKPKLLERLVNPPSEVYEYVGFSKLEIKPSGRDYGLLFE